MHNLDLIITLTAGLAVALVFGFLAVRFKLPTIVGYLLAGLLIGPYTPRTSRIFRLPSNSPRWA